MSNQFGDAFDPTSLAKTLFPANSRYHGIETETIADQDGKETIYLQRRFLPQPLELQETLRHTVLEGDRLDNLAFAFIGDPEQFWRICDGNFELNPMQLAAVPGKTIRLTSPQELNG